MTYVDNEENQNFEMVQIETPMNTPTPVPKDYHTKIPTCITFSMEEGVVKRVKVFENKKVRHYSRRNAHLEVFSYPHCKIICHTCCPEDSKIKHMNQF